MSPSVYEYSRDLLRLNILIILFACGFAVYFLLPTFTNPYALNDDVRVFLFWVHKFHDSELFRDDPLRLFSEAYTAWGVKVLYRFLSFFGDPFAAVRLLPVVLFAAAAHFIFRLGLLFGGVFTGVLAAAAFMSSQFFLFPMSGGIPRSFAPPLGLAFLYSLARQRALPAAVLLVLQPLFYTPVFLISAVTAFLCAFRIRKLRLHPAFPGIRLVLAAAVLGCLIVLGQAFLNRHPSIGPLMSRAELLENRAAVTMPGGRNEIFPLRPLRNIVIEEGRKIVSHLLPVYSFADRFPGAARYSQTDILNFTAFFLLLLLAARSARERKLPMPEVLAFIGAGLLLVEAAHLFLFHLYFPNRYWLFSFPAGVLLVFAGTLAWILGAVKPLFFRRVLQAALVLIVVSHNVKAFPMPLFMDASGGRKIYEFLRTLPKDALIAAHPYVADNIPTFAARKTFIMYEVSNVFFTTHWEFVKKRTYELFDAYFAGEAGIVADFMERNDIDYLVVDTWHFTSGYLERDRLYFEPFESYLREMISKRQNFFLANIPKDKILFSDGRHFVIGRGREEPGTPA